MGSVEVPLCRDDCETVKRRTKGWSCVFAKIVSMDPFEIADTKGRIRFEEIPQGSFELMDYAYVLIDTSSRPLRCVRITVVPKELEPIAAYQLEQFLKKNQSS